MNNADLIVATLKAAGIDRGFGIPSGNVLPLMEAMRKGGVDFVLTAHEGSAGFAADVTGRMTGAPGPLHRHARPRRDQSRHRRRQRLARPLADDRHHLQPRTPISSAAASRCGSTITRCSSRSPRRRSGWRRARSPRRVNEAIRIAMSEPRGPVHLDLPEDVALAPAREATPRR